MQTTLSYPVTLERWQFIADATVHERSPAWLALLGLAKGGALDVHAVERVAPELSSAACRLVIQSLAAAGLLSASGALTAAGREALSSRLVPRSEVGCFEVLIASGPGLPRSGIPCWIRRAPELQGIRLEHLREVTSALAGMPRVVGRTLTAAGGGQIRLDRLYDDPSGKTVVRRPPLSGGLRAKRFRSLDFATGTNSHVIELSGLDAGEATRTIIELEPLPQEHVLSLLCDASFQANQQPAPGPTAVAWSWDAGLHRLGASSPPPGLSLKGAFEVALDATCQIPGEDAPDTFTLKAVPVGPKSRDRASRDAWFTALLATEIPPTPVIPDTVAIESLERRIAEKLLVHSEVSADARDARIARWRGGTPEQRHLAFRLGVRRDFESLPGLSA